MEKLFHSTVSSLSQIGKSDNCLVNLEIDKYGKSLGIVMKTNYIKKESIIVPNVPFSAMNFKTQASYFI